MGNVVFGQLVDSNCAVPLLMVSALLLAGGTGGSTTASNQTD